MTTLDPLQRSAAGQGEPVAEKVAVGEDFEHCVYIVRCADGSLYTGYARDPRARLRMHNSGKGARYTSSRRPVRLVYSEACRTLSRALRREYELKQLPRKKKQQLIRGQGRQGATFRSA